VWSALNEAYFSINTVAASAGNLVISKIHYRPAAPTAAEISAGFTERSDFEFLEVMNISPQRVDLGGLSFSLGLDIRPITGGVRELGPGERALYVAKSPAFVLRYGSGFPIAGEFVLGSNLSNDGERLTLLAADASQIVSFIYRPTAPWPSAPNGGGNSLVLVRPRTSDPNVAWSWRSSTAVNGAPGADDRLLFAAWRSTNFSSSDSGFPGIAEPTADPDGDGSGNLLEYFNGTNPKLPSSSRLPTITSTVVDSGGGPQLYPVFSFRHVKAAEELSYFAEASTNLDTWSSAALVLHGTPTDHGDGTETRSYRSTAPMSTATAQFFRLRLQMP
jgi:hypothetical protein